MRELCSVGVYGRESMNELKESLRALHKAQPL